MWVTCKHSSLQRERQGDGKNGPKGLFTSLISVYERALLLVGVKTDRCCRSKFKVLEPTKLQDLLKHAPGQYKPLEASALDHLSEGDLVKVSDLFLDWDDISRLRTRFAEVCVDLLTLSVCIGVFAYPDKENSCLENADVFLVSLQIAFIHNEDLWIVVDSVDSNTNAKGEETGIGKLAVTILPVLGTSEWPSGAYDYINNITRN